LRPFCLHNLIIVLDVDDDDDNNNNGSFYGCGWLMIDYRK